VVSVACEYLVMFLVLTIKTCIYGEKIEKEEAVLVNL
jgi:hypothetical protein